MVRCPQFKTVKPDPGISTAEVSFNFPRINLVRSRDFNLMPRKKWGQSYHYRVRGGNVADGSVGKWKSLDCSRRSSWLEEQSAEEEGKKEEKQSLNKEDVLNMMSVLFQIGK